MKRILLAVFALGLTVAFSAAQDEAVEIKVGRKQAGDSARITVNKKSKIDITFGGATKVESGSEKSIYIETIVDKPDPKKKPTKATRKYESIELIKGGQTLETSYAGQTVTIEKKGSSYTFTVSGKALPAPEAERFASEFKDVNELPIEEDLLPGKAVKVGEEWKINAAKAFGKKSDDNPFVVDTDKSAGTAKLVKTYVKDGHKYGVIEINAKLPVTSMKIGRDASKTNDGSKLGVKMTLDVAIDGSTPYGKATSHIDIDISLEAPSIGTVTLKGGEEGEMSAEKAK